MNVRRGDRVQLISCPDSITIDWSKPELVTASIAENKPEYLVLILDYPLNTNPTQEEVTRAKLHVMNQNAAHVLKIPKNLNCTFKSLPDGIVSNPNCMLRCFICNQYTPRRLLVITCRQHRHMCCPKDLMPVLPNTQVPNLEIIETVNDHFKLYTEIRNLPMKPDTDTRSLLCFETYSRSMRRKDQEFVIHDFYKYDLWTCYVCKEYGITPAATIPFKYVHEQIFGPGGASAEYYDQKREETNSGKESENTPAPSPAKVLPNKRLYPLLFYQLEARGFDTSDIDALISDNTQNDIENWDLEMASGLLASRNLQGSQPISNAKQTISNRFESHTTLGKRIRLRLFSPEHKKCIGLIFPADTMYRHIVFMAIKKLDLGCLPSDLIVHRVDSAGWSVEVFPEGDHSSFSISVNDLEEDDTLTFRRVITGLIGPRLTPENASDRMDTTSVSKFAALGNNYVGMRKIKGDGNCYYRAVIVGLFEQIFQSGERLRFRKLHDLLAKAIFTKDDKGSAAQNALLAMISEAAETLGSRWKTWEDLEADILDTGGIDETMIRACRQLVAQYLLDHEKEEITGVPLGELILSCYENVRDMKDYCEQYVTKMGVDAEGAFIELGLLPLSLGCRCTIIYLDRIQGNELKAFESGVGTGADESTSSKEESLGHVHLLLRPGHYDLLYPELPSPPHYPAVDIENIEVVTIPSAGKTSSEPEASTEKVLSHATETLNGSDPLNKPKKINDDSAPAISDLSNPPESIVPDSTDLPRSLEPPKSPSRNQSDSLPPLPPNQRHTIVAEPIFPELAQQLCDILSISKEAASELCKRASTVESAVAYYYESLEGRIAVPPPRPPQSSPSPPRSSFFSGNLLGKKDKPLEVDPSQYEGNSSDIKVAQLSRLIGVTEQEARRLLLQFNGSITDAADYYQRLLVEDLPSPSRSSMSLFSFSKSNQTQAGKNLARSDSEEAKSTSQGIFSRLFGNRKPSPVDMSLSPSTVSPSNKSPIKGGSKVVSPEPSVVSSPTEEIEIDHVQTYSTRDARSLTMTDTPDGEVFVSFKNPSFGKPLENDKAEVKQRSGSRSRWFSKSSPQPKQEDLSSPSERNSVKEKKSPLSFLTFASKSNKLGSQFRSKEDVMRLDDADVDKLPLEDSKRALRLLRGMSVHLPSAAEYRREVKEAILYETRGSRTRDV